MRVLSFTALRLCLAAVVALAASCDVVPATNPFDPTAPPELQRPAVLVGRVVLEDATAPRASLLGELGNLELILRGANGRDLENADNTPVRATTEIDDDDDDVALAFSFSDIVPGRYSFRVAGVGSRYAPPQLPIIDLGPGAIVDVGDVVFSAGDTGPGTIEGAVRLVGAAGGARNVELFRLTEAGPELLASRRTDIDAAFRFGGLAVGRYAVVSTLEGFTPDHRLDVEIGEAGDARLAFSFAGDDALTLHPVTAVLLPTIQQTEGRFYTREDSVPLAVLAFGGVTTMRLSTDAGFLEGDVAVPFVPFSAQATVPLPDRQGDIPVFAQFEAAANGFSFLSPTFSTTVVRDVTAPRVVAAAPPGVARNDDGSFFITGDTVSLTLDIDATDDHSAVAGVAIVAGDGTTIPDSTGVSFVDVTSVGGLTRINQPVPVLAGEGPRPVFVFVRDRAGNVSAPFRVDLVVDTGAVSLPLLVESTGGQLRSRIASLSFDETGAPELPVAMQVGVAPLRSNVPVVPYEDSVAVAVEGAHGSVVAFEARLFDAAGNSVVVRSDSVVLTLVADIDGAVLLEGVPTLRTSHAGARVQLLRNGLVQETLAADSGAFAFPGVPEGDGYRVAVTVAGYSAVEQLLPPILANSVVTVPTIPVRLGRGELGGRFQLADQQQNGEAHGGILVVATLGGLDRRLTLTAVTTPTGEWRIGDVPVTRVGEVWSVEGVAQGYSRAVAGEVEVQDGLATVVSPNADDATIADPVLLQPNAGDFDLCAPTGACVPLAFTNLDTLRVRLRAAAGVEQVRVQARTAFSESDANPPFVAFDTLNEPTIDVRGADGTVEVFVQVVVDGSPGPVLRSSFVRDTVAPTTTAFGITPHPLALDPQFTSASVVRARIDADAGVGNVAPLASARLAFAEAAPVAPPAGATLCAHGVECDVALPRVVAVVEERAFTLFGFACDAAGNCSTTPSSARIVHDRTPPSALHGVEVDPTGAGLVTVNGTTFTRSPSTRTLVDVGRARTGAGVEVRDLGNQPVADVFAVRLGLEPLLLGSATVNLEGTLLPDSQRELIAPALPADDGVSTIFAQLIDAAGNRTNVEPNTFFYDLTLDTQPPSPSFRLNADAATTTSETVTLTVTADPLDRPTRVRIATDDGLFGTFVERAFPFAAGQDTFTLPAAAAPGGDGTYTVFARFFDAAGNFNDRQDSIRLDRTPPIVQGVVCSSCANVDGALFSNASNRQIVMDADAFDTGGFVRELRVQVGTGAVATVAFGLPFTVTLPADGAHVIAVRAVDDAGNISPASLLTVTLDRTAPAVSVAIDGGADFTRSPDVVLTITATDAVAGLHTLRVAPSAAFTGVPQPFTNVLAFRVDAAGTDGSKSAFVEVRDAAGNIAVASDSITLDTAAPAGTLVIDGGAAFSADRSVALALTFPADTNGFAVAEGGLDCATASYTATTGTSASVPAFSVSPGDGNKTIAACFRDRAGNTASAAASVTLDESAPEAAVVINNGATFATSSTVGLTLSATPDTVEMSIATSGVINCATATYETFATSRTVSLPAGQGSRTVAVCFRDRAGNTRQASASIVVDSVAPTLSLVLNGGATHTNSGVATVAFVTTTDVVAAAVTTAGSIDCATAVYEAFQATRLVPLPAGDGAKTVRACVKDQAGNTTQANTGITVDTVAPIVTPTLAGGASRIRTQSTTLSATSTEDIVFAIGVGVLDCAAASYSATFVSSVPSTAVTLADNDGTQQVVLCAKDRAGNIGAAARSVELDRQGPTAALRINDGSTHAASTSATVFFLDASSDSHSVFVTTGALSDCAGVANGSFVAFTASRALTLANTDGSQTVRACLRDDVDNRTLLTPVSVVLDRVAPTAPSALTITDQVRSVVVASGGRSRDAQPRLSFTASADANGGPATYQLQLASEPTFANPEFSVALGTTTSFSPPGELTDRTWHWRVTARDAAGNTTPSATSSFTVDRTAPQAPLLDAIAPFIRTSTNATWTAADADSATFRVEVLRGSPGVQVFSTTTASTLQALTVGAQLLAGTQTGTAYQVRVRAIDLVGNESAAATTSFVFDDGAPCQNTSALRLNNSAGFVDGIQFTNTGATLASIGCNGEPPTHMRVNCDGASAAASPLVAFQPDLTCSLNTASQGNKSVSVILEDAAGNQRTVNGRTIFFDDASPSTPRFTVPEAVVGTTTLTLSPLALQSVDPNGAGGSSFTATPYEVRTTASASPIAWNGTSSLVVALVEGDNALRVRAVDRARNASDEDLVIVKRDTSRPTVTDLVAEAGNGDIVLSWSTTATDVERFEVLYGPISSTDPAAYTGSNADQGFSPVDVGTSTSMRLTGMPNGTPVFVAVRAFDGVGSGSLARITTAVIPNEVPLLRAGSVPSPDAGRARGVAWADGIAFVIYGCNSATSCTSSGIRAFDVSDPEQPTLIGSLLRTDGVFAFATDISILGDRAYVADGPVIRVVNIGNPVSMSLTSSTTIPNEIAGTDFALALQARPGQLFVAAEAEGLLVYDILSDVGTLTFRDACNSVDGGCMFSRSFRAVSVAVQGDFAYVGNGDFVGSPAAVEVVDITTSTNPIRFSTGRITTLTAWDLEFHGRLLYFAQNGMLRVHNISGTSFTETQGRDEAAAQSSGQPLNVTVAGPYVYVVDNDGGGRIKVLSSENRSANNREMRLLGEAPTDGQGQFNVCDLTGSGSPFGIVEGSCGASAERLFAVGARIAVAGNLLLEANRTHGFVVYRIGQPVRPREVAHLPLATDGRFGAGANGLGLGMKGRNLINAGRTGVAVYRVDNAANPATIGTLGNPIDHHVLGLVDDTLYLARDSTMEQYRFSSAGGTAALSTSEAWRLQDLSDFGYGNTKSANALHVRWPFAYLLLSDSGGNANTGNELKVINLRSGLVTATIPLPDGGGFRDGAIAYHRNRLYITRGRATNVTIVDITNRGSPSTTLGTLAVSEAAGASVQGTQLYVGGFNQLRVFSLSDPAAPTLLGSTGFGGAVLQASGDFVYSSREPRPVILKVTDPSAIQLVAQPGRLRFEEGVLVVGKHVFMQDRDELSVIELQ